MPCGPRDVPLRFAREVPPTLLPADADVRLVRIERDMTGDLGHRGIGLLVRPDRVVDGVSRGGDDVVVARVALEGAVRGGVAARSTDCTTSPDGMYCTAG